MLSGEHLFLRKLEANFTLSLSVDRVKFLLDSLGFYCDCIFILTELCLLKCPLGVLLTMGERKKEKERKRERETFVKLINVGPVLQCSTSNHPL